MTKKTPTTFSKYGVTWTDDYTWLREKSDSDLIPTLEEENKKTNHALSHLVSKQEKIFQEIVSKILEDDEEYPYPVGDYEYFSRMAKGKNYPQYFRKANSSAPAELLLDLNEKGGDKKFLHMSTFEISPDQKKIAYAIDFNGDEKYTLFIKDISTGKIIDDSIKFMTGDFEWGDDSSIYYTAMDSTHRPDRVFIHNLQTPSESDQLIFEDKNLSYYVGISKSKSQRFIWITTSSKITTEVSFIDLSKSLTKTSLFSPRKDDVKYYVDHHEERFIILTNENAENFKLMFSSISDFKKESWTPLVPYDPNRSIDGVEIFKNHIVIVERYEGLQNFRVIDNSSQKITSVDFNEPLYAISLDNNHVYDTPTLRFIYSSLKTPQRTEHYDLITHKHTTVKTKVIPGFDSNQYTTERLFAPSRDGKTLIPISLIYKNEFKKDGKSPAFIYGYGSYGMTRNPSFTPSIFSLLDRGFVYAIAHIRGGGDCGRTWYNAGKLLKKENTFFDFIDCGKFLIHEKFTQAGKIAICGGSAGGLLMGAVTNLEPTLWGAVVALVPFVDIINTMLDESLPLTVTEYDEWGTPHNPEYFKYMLSYSPYDNITDKSYPPIFATGGLHDPRVGYWEPCKWVFKLREHQKSQKNPILLKIQMEAGHQGPSGRYDAYREVAIYYSFVIDQIKAS